MTVIEATNFRAEIKLTFFFFLITKMGDKTNLMKGCIFQQMRRALTRFGGKMSVFGYSLMGLFGMA